MHIKRQGRIQPLWHRLASGHIVPAGTHTNLSLHWQETFIEIKEKAAVVEQLYRENGINLPPSSDLGQLIVNARIVCDSWLLSPTGRISMPLVYKVAHFNRVANALIPLRGTPACPKFLAQFRSGNLDLLQRERSSVKNTLWELELSSMLRSRSFEVSFEEPDIITTFATGKVGIACKKLYSEKHVQNVLSNAVQQIESGVDLGIVALNLDDLVPPNSTLEAPSLHEAELAVNQMNNSFLARHDRHFRKYLASGRLLSALVSTAVLVEVPGRNFCVHNIRRASIWAMEGLPAEKEQRLREFYNRLML